MVRRSCCISGLLLAVAALAQGADSAACTARRLEAELAVARKPEVYLVVDLESPALMIKVRGIALEEFHLTEAAALGYHAPGEERARPPLELPVAWTVTEEPISSFRRVIAPQELLPMSEENEEAKPATPAGGPPPEPPVPSAYQVALAGGWVLAVGQELPHTSFLTRLRHRFEDGWARFRGQAPSRPDLLAIAMSADEARSLLHLFRPGTTVLVLGECGSAADAPGTPGDGPPAES